MAKKIMIFDDEADVLFIMRLRLESLGYEVVTKQTCEKIIEVVGENQPALVIMDNWIPDIGGIEATKLLKNDNLLKKIPVIMCTASKDAKAISDSAGADGYIEKPFDLKLLIHIVTKHLEAN